MSLQFLHNKSSSWAYSELMSNSFNTSFYISELDPSKNKRQISTAKRALYSQYIKAPTSINSRQ